MDRDKILLTLCKLGLSWKSFWKIFEQLGDLELLAEQPKVIDTIKGIKRNTKQKITSLNWSDDPTEKPKKLGMKYITVFSPDYPPRLKKMPYPPYVLFYRGDLSVLEKPCVAIVGSRKASIKGRELAKEYAKRCAKEGKTVVSGLALGIDSEAHIGALEANGSTAAVLGSSLDYIYPPENRNLCKRIEKTGVVLSPFFPTTKPSRYNFPIRNEIIAALSEKVVVVEAMEKSGALITADIAKRLNIPVATFSLPYPGNQKLLKEGAEAIELRKDKRKDTTNEPILQLLKNGPLSADEISQKLNIDISTVQVKLMELELQGKIRRLSGGFYEEV